ncbi:MAG: 16S rRNA (uracil(1498)-N(3))-methyltransferase [Firmicutes bacterium]|jgi:16S rRNA (uracil1498-N3)-methyltransferase|nr:16S rRNA (uracil(1498)-N(3))-methyltransferase [Bacillota bacterium]NLL88356.1 16S rRNA (uracil(1498)-N(3))-methyltransferase [Bacillota bacterium]HKM18049.1 16S rRNA (uracil(1498)-N(3))-methyltransferase [Limnochordia bacterium]
MVKVFVPSGQVSQGKVTVTGGDAHHLRSVLRKKPGDQVLIGVIGGAGSRAYEGVIVAVDSSKVICELLSPVKVQTEPQLKACLCQAVAKGGKMDLVIQKSVELGVTEIVPFFSQYTVVRLDGEKSRQRQERWQKIAEAAAKQCRRDTIPQVHLPVSFDQLAAALAHRDEDHLLLMPYEQEQNRGLAHIQGHLPKQPRQVSIVIGPEGGFCPEEVERIKTINGEIITLGPRILRTETAAVAVLALVQFLWGDLG